MFRWRRWGEERGGLLLAAGRKGLGVDWSPSGSARGLGRTRKDSDRLGLGLGRGGVLTRSGRLGRARGGGGRTVAGRGGRGDGADGEAAPREEEGPVLGGGGGGGGKKGGPGVYARHTTIGGNQNPHWVCPAGPPTPHDTRVSDRLVRVRPDSDQGSRCAVLRCTGERDDVCRSTGERMDVCRSTGERMDVCRSTGERMDVCGCT